MLNRRKFSQTAYLAFLLALKGCKNLRQADSDLNGTTSNSELFILWERGYLPEENQGIVQLVQEWEEKSGKKINLRIVSDEFIERTLVNFLHDSGLSLIPDIVFSISFNHIIAPLLAWQDKLIDLSTLIQPHTSRFFKHVLTNARYFNQVKGESSYYALPVGQSDAYIHYWQNLLAEIGYNLTDIPKDWSGFWEFWKVAQSELHLRQNSDIYGIGLSLSANGFDTIAAFQLFLDAHNLAITSQERGLVLTEPANRQGFIDVLTEFSDLFKQGFIPPDALEWSGSGNNIAFLNQKILMTLNMTLSIPRTQNLPNNLYNQKAAQRYQQIGTLASYPNKLDGTTLWAPRVVNQILALKQGAKNELVLDFLQYLVQPKHLQRLMQGFNGRIIPITPSLLKDSLWLNSSDPHSAAAMALFNQPSGGEDNIQKLLLGEIYMNQLWSQTIQRVLSKQNSPMESGSWTIEQIQRIWNKYERYL